MRIKLQILFVICLLAIAVFAQDESKAVKIAEFDDRTETTEKFAENARLLMKKVAETSGVYGVIAIYPRDVSLYKNLFEKAHNLVEQNPAVKNRIEIIPAPGARYENENFRQTEFWLVPDDAQPPYVQMIADCVCPSIEIRGEQTFDNFAAPLAFSVNVTGLAEDAKYKWTVSGGEIIEGQGTNVIKVDLSKTSVEKLTVTVELENDLKSGCDLCIRTAKFETVFVRR